MHSFGNIHDVMQTLPYKKKGLHLNRVERFHIHIEAASNNPLSDDRKISPKRIFETIFKNLPNVK